jgi:hypothetical protein
MPAAMPAPMIAPIDDPEIAAGRMPSSSSASMTWIWDEASRTATAEGDREGRVDLSQACGPRPAIP